MSAIILVVASLLSMTGLPGDSISYADIVAVLAMTESLWMEVVITSLGFRSYNPLHTRRSFGVFVIAKP